MQSKSNSMAGEAYGKRVWDSGEFLKKRDIKNTIAKRVPKKGKRITNNPKWIKI